MTVTDRDATEYGDRIAQFYESWYSEQTPATVPFLAALAGGGRALELGVGTGRIAIPLAATGVETHGVDISEAMVARLRAKPGSEAVTVRVGDIAHLEPEGSFDLVYAVHSVFFGITTQEQQVECFQTVARHLTPGGVFVHEAFVPSADLLSGNSNLQATAYGTDRVLLEVIQVDPVAQVQESRQLFFHGGAVELVPFRIRYVWPSELDLMARLAGMRLRSRTFNWEGEPFTARHSRHVSVYELA
ncbi:class I SAM-dependent DNA methyltransferase [Longispora urticae]